MEFPKFEAQIEAKMREVCEQNPDPSHDMLHVKRVVGNAQRLSVLEDAKLDVVMPAAYLHDVVYIHKGDPRRALASHLSAVEARRFLTEIGYPEIHLDAICHAIEAHSFSAGNEAKSLEAKIVQDADRLDAIGAIGIARCFAFSGLAKRPIHESEDPFAEERGLDDSTNTLDHFSVKLLKLPEKMQTPSGRSEAFARLKVLKSYLKALESELHFSQSL